MNNGNTENKSDDGFTYVPKRGRPKGTKKFTPEEDRKRRNARSRAWHKENKPTGVRLERRRASNREWKKRNADQQREYARNYQRMRRAAKKAEKAKQKQAAATPIFGGLHPVVERKFQENELLRQQESAVVE